MIRLQPLTQDQEFYVTPFEARKFLPTFVEYLFEFQSQATSEKFYMIGNALDDNERFSRFQIDTSADFPTSGDVKLAESGLYTFAIYGQNSGTNIDPTDASVVGLLERGTLQVIGADAWTLPTINVPNNVVYYE